MTSPSPAPEAFYVGYQPKAPPGLGRFLGATTGLLLAAGVGVAVALGLIQRPPAPAVFEFGRPRPLAGVVIERPYPMLLVAGPGRNPSVSAYLLTGPGKRGVAPLVAGRGGQRLSAQMVLLYRGPHTMAEVTSAAFDSPAAAAAPPAIEDLGEVTVTGEIVDSKCYLGAMNPGAGATHRGCAVRCLRGGLPPLLVLRSEAHQTELLLAGRDGGSLDERILAYIGLSVRVTGRLRRLASWVILEADPEAIRIVSP